MSYVYTCPYCKEKHDVEFSECRFEKGNFFPYKEETPLRGLYNDGGRKKAGFETVAAGDCVVRAISLALNQDYKTTWNEFNTLIKNGTPDIGVKDRITNKYLKKKGWIYNPLKKAKAIKEHLPEDIIILKVKQHLVCVSGHTFFDTFDFIANGQTKVFGYYIKAKDEK